MGFCRLCSMSQQSQLLVKMEYIGMQLWHWQLVFHISPRFFIKYIHGSHYLFILYNVFVPSSTTVQVYTKRIRVKGAVAVDSMRQLCLSLCLLLPHSHPSQSASLFISNRLPSPSICLSVYLSLSLPPPSLALNVSLTVSPSQSPSL